MGSHARDHSELFPSHRGRHILPNNPFFTRLLRHAHRGRTAIRDRDLDVVKTYADLLSDALSLREAIRGSLPPETLSKLNRGDEVYIGILAAGGYEFAVAMVAVLAIGAAAVPMTVANPPEEVAYFVTKAKQVALISSFAASALAQSVVRELQKNDFTIPHVEVRRALFSSTNILRPQQIMISSDRYLDDNSAGIVIFTSGTTGRPKGSVLRRAYIHEVPLALIDGYNITQSDVLLHILPVHHATGLGTSFFPFLNIGACIEFRTGSFSARWVWDRFREGGITIFSGVPTVFLRLMWHYQQEISQLPQQEVDAYKKGANDLRALLCGSSALQSQVQDFWTNIRNGRPIFVRYGSSEIPACIRVPAWVDLATLPKNTIGFPVAGVDARIAEDGELFIKSPYMFSKYLFDEPATIAAHDDQGWFKTGDIVQVENGFFFVVGRASVDIIKSGGYKIGAPEIERICLDLPYIAESAVVGVPDEEFGQRVGAIVTLSPNQARTGSQLTIDRLRDDMRKSLPAYKLPTLLRIYDGELPKGQTGKVQKKDLGPQAFHEGKWQQDPKVQAWIGRNQNRAKI